MGFGDCFRESEDRDEGCLEHGESTRKGPGPTSWYGQGAMLLKEASLASFPAPDLKALGSPAEKGLHQLSFVSAFFEGSRFATCAQGPAKTSKTSVGQGKNGGAGPWLFPRDLESPAL